MVEQRDEVIVVEIEGPWTRQVVHALERIHVDGIVVDPRSHSWRRENVRNRLHIVPVVGGPQSSRMGLVRAINDLGGTSLVITERRVQADISESCLDIRRAYSVPNNISDNPDLLAQTAKLMLRGS